MFTLSTLSTGPGVDHREKGFVMSNQNLAEKAVSWVSHQMRQRAPYQGENPFLEGPFAPVADERTDRNLQVEGSLPPELDGLYARIGPNPLKVDNPGMYHWFTGDGMVHGVRLSGGQALWYRNRYIGSDTVRDHQQQPHAAGPRRGPSGVVNTNVFGHAGSIWAATEAGVLPVELDAELNTRRYGYFNSEVSLPFTAHPHVDPATGSLHAICYDAPKFNELQYVAISATGQVEKTVSIPVRHGPMVHDCAITARHVIVLDLPITFSFPDLLKGHLFPYRWNPRHGARVGLLPRDGSADDLRWFAVDPCAVFHTANAYELDDGRVVLDLVVHPRQFEHSKIGPDLGAAQITFERWTMDPARPEAGVSRHVWSTMGQEFPRYDERLTGRPYRYAYTVGVSDEPDASTPLIRHDLHTGQVTVRDFGSRCLAGEFVFVPRQGGTAEDDGWLMGLVYDGIADRSRLEVLKADDLTGPPQAVVHLDARVPMGFHGNWIPLGGR